MIKQLKTCYLIGGPYDLTKRSIDSPPIEIIFFEPVEYVDITFSESGRKDPIKCLPVVYKLAAKANDGVLIYLFQGV